MTIAEIQLLESPQPHRFTRQEYYQMADLGFFEGKRVELIEGKIIDMAPMKDLHAIALGLIHSILIRTFPNNWVRCQVPLTFVDDTDPEPDFAVVAGTPRNYKGKGHPTTAILVIEISDTTLRFDRNGKARLYAAAGVADYWVVNLDENVVEVFREPIAGATTGSGYRAHAIYRTGQNISPLAAPSVTIPVADMLP